MKTNKLILIILFLLLAVNPIFAQSKVKISGNLLKMAENAGKKTVFAKTASAAAAENLIEVLFYPIDKNSDRIDLSFFAANNIKYIKSRNFLSAEVPAKLVSELDKISGVEYIDISPQLKPLETVTEGRDVINASDFVFSNIDGTGVSVAVVDVGFRNYASLQSAGELPSRLEIVDFTGGNFQGHHHGSACAEIVYDIAPGAEMHLIAVSNLPSIQNAYDYIRSKNINIVSASIGFAIAGDSFVDGTGAASEIVDNAASRGVLSVYAAGNEANESWLGRFKDNGSGWMQFPDGNDYLEINMMFGTDVYFIWDDFVACNKEYVLYLYDSATGSLIDSTENSWSNGFYPAVFAVNYTSAGNVKLKIKKTVSSTPDLDMKLYFPDSYYVKSSLRNSESSLSSPGDSRTALTVGAVNVTNWANGPVEYYSSRGPSRASQAAATSAIKPEVVGPTYVSTVSYGSRGFNGTSGATPHISAAAALLLSINPGMPPGQLKTEVVSYARQIASSPDNIYGYGKLVLETSIIPPSETGNIVCFPVPASISKTGYMKITNLPFNTALIDINIFTVAGEFVKSFDRSDMRNDNGRMTIKWDLKNQGGSQVAPGVYFMTIETPLGRKTKKIAIVK